MTPEFWQKVDALFQTAACAPPEERQAFLDRESAGDASLRAEVRELLAADEQASREGFLDPVKHRSADSPRGNDSLHRHGRQPGSNEVRTQRRRRSQLGCWVGSAPGKRRRKPLQQPDARRHSDHPGRLRWFSPQECVLGQPLRRRLRGARSSGRTRPLSLRRRSWPRSPGGDCACPSVVIAPWSWSSCC